MSNDDQVRTTTPGDAVRMGADYLVVAVIQSSAPFDAAQRIIDEIAAA